MSLKNIVNWFYEKYLRYVISRDVSNLVFDWVQLGNKNSKDISSVRSILEQNLILVKDMATQVDALNLQVKKLSEKNECPWGF